MKVNNFETHELKVNDSDGNPVNIAAIIVWQVADTAKATFAVENSQHFVEVQSESALRHVASTHPYDNADPGEESLRGSTELVAKELAIVEIKVPQAAGELARQVVEFVQSVRRMELRKRPGIAETLDWTAALLRLGLSSLDDDGAERILDTLSALIKTREDRAGFTRDVVARIAAAC